MNKLREYNAIAKINYKHSTWIAYLTAGICVLAMLVDVVLDKLIPAQQGDTSIAAYNMLYLIPLLAPIFIASVNYRKLMNIGVKKRQYFHSCIINYTVFAAIVSLFGVIGTYITTPAVLKLVNYKAVHGLVEVFSWNSNVLTAFFSQFFFLLLLESIVHTLTFIQTKWYGIAADVFIIVIISVFIPIPALRKAIDFFFDLIIFSAPLAQIAICALLAVLIYSTNLMYLKRRS